MIKPVVLTCAAALVLSGCTVRPENAYPEATTARECTVLHEAAQRQGRQNMAMQSVGSSNSVASGIGAAIGRGMAESVMNNRYQMCLARVGGTAPQPAPQGMAPMQSELFTPAPTGYCPANASVLYGGTSYCL